MGEYCRFCKISNGSEIRIITKDKTILEIIADCIKKGCTNGHYPFWKLSLNGFRREELSDGTWQHIAGAVFEGYIGGEMIEDDENSDNNGWWKLKIQ